MAGIGVTSRLLAGGRATAVSLLITLACLAAAFTPVTMAMRSLLVDEGTFVSALAPLAHNSDVQASVIKAVDSTLSGAINPASVKAAVPGAQTATAAQLQDITAKFINDNVTAVVQSPAFVALWTTTSRTAHTLVRTLLLDKPVHVAASGISTPIYLDLSPLTQAVGTRLAALGVTVPPSVPQVVPVNLVRLPDLSNARTVAQRIDQVGTWIPWVTALLFVAAIALARRRRRTAIVAAVSLAITMVVLIVVLGIGRSELIQRNTSATFDKAALGHLYDAAASPLRGRIVVMLVVAAGIGLATGATYLRRRRAEVAIA